MHWNTNVADEFHLLCHKLGTNPAVTYKMLHHKISKIALYYGVLIAAFGWKSFLLVYAPVVFLSSALSVWLFYVQHQYEDTYWRYREAWNYYAAGLEGSSYFELPRILQWFTGNIGFHHIHHVCSRIPNYNLQRA